MKINSLLTVISVFSLLVIGSMFQLNTNKGHAWALSPAQDFTGFEATPSVPPPLPTESSSSVGTAAEANEGNGDRRQVVGNRTLADIARSGGPLMIPIGICSFILVVFVFERFLSLRRTRIIPRHFVKRFLDQLRDGELNRDSAVSICEKNNSPVAQVFKAGVMKWGRSAVEVEQAVLDEGERVSNHLRKYLRLINGVATVCPLLGLLGTVLGMIQAFDSIATAGNAMADPKVLIATGISQALITTAAGMTVAIPALIAYLFFSSRVDRHTMEIDSLGMKVVSHISAESLVTSSSTGKRRAA